MLIEIGIKKININLPGFTIPGNSDPIRDTIIRDATQNYLNMSAIDICRTIF